MQMPRISLKAARVNANMTQAEVAAALKKSKVTINAWEQGKARIDLANFKMLCDLYKMPESAIVLPCESS
jgi:transcriptional regulator with XRE-family HTH domain